MNAEYQREAILRELAPLFDQARSSGFWFFCNSIHTGPLWMSPDELQAAHAEGRFIWGAVNWQLRDPLERLAQLRQAFLDAKTQHDEFGARLHAEVERSEVKR